MALRASVQILFGRLLIFGALAAGLMVTSPVMAQSAKEKEPAKPFKIDKPIMEHPITYAIDADASHDLENILLLDLSNGGRVVIRLQPQWAPAHVERIKTLTRQGFYDGLIFHRVIEGFMAQTGDPTGTGQGGSKLPDLKAEFNDAPHMRGTVSMARTNEPNTANSQFFIVFYPHYSLDHKYTNFGRVIAGMDVVDQVVRGEPPAHPTRILQASIAADHKPRPAPIAPGSAPSITADMLSHSQSQ